MSARINPEVEEKELVCKFYGQKRDGVFVEVSGVIRRRIAVNSP